MLLTEAFDLNFSQGEVDFVIPRLDEDLPLCIDPFLMYKSRDDELQTLHDHLLSLFNTAVRLFREGNDKEFTELIDFPEVNEVGLGYSEGAIRGSGLGQHLNNLLAETLASSEDLRVRGLRHVEELQLLSLGIGADRVSDIAANALKQYLVEYTQRQATLWDIPRRQVCRYTITSTSKNFGGVTVILTFHKTRYQGCRYCWFHGEQSDYSHGLTSTTTQGRTIACS